MNAGRYYLSPEAQATLRAHNDAARARLALKREERAAVEHAFEFLQTRDVKQAQRRFTGQPITFWGDLA